MQKLALCFGLLGACVWSTTAVAADLGQKGSCTTTSRVKTIGPKSFQVFRGDGIPASDITNFNLTILESRYANCSIETKYTYQFNIYNHWEANNGASGHAGIYISFLQNGRSSLKNAIVFGDPLGFCRGPFPVGPIDANVRLNLFDVIDDISIDSDRVSGSVGPC
jgi:hypothetical protein